MTVMGLTEVIQTVVDSPNVVVDSPNVIEGSGISHCHPDMLLVGIQGCDGV